ncbi:MAG: MurR/RpiR family transcriptional regulator [Eubacteriales bacterium]|jgi:DNA-binding MurR/RpiR family transcriptional regulator|nr:MurR/RpiR family transcriptional regulator [Eubacteriales bacterium]
MTEDLIQRIKASMPFLSKSQRAIGNFICNHYNKAAYMTAAKLGDQVGVSESTVVRFAIEMGYDGYPSLRQDLRELIRTRLTAIQRVEITNDRIGSADVLENILNSDIDKIKETLDQINRTDFDRAVDMILSARTVYVAGARTSSPLASFLSSGLSLMFANVHPVVSGANEISEQLIHAAQGDVVIAISFPRYSKRIIDAVGNARRSGAQIIALTDSHVSPIARYAAVLLTAKSDMASFVDSLVAPLSIINALIVAISRKKKNELEDIFARLEAVWQENDMYDRN